MIEKIHELCKHLDKEGQDAGLLSQRFSQEYGHTVDFQPIYELAVRLGLVREKEKRAQTVRLNPPPTHRPMPQSQSCAHDR